MTVDLEYAAMVTESAISLIEDMAEELDGEPFGDAPKEMVEQLRKQIEALGAKA